MSVIATQVVSQGGGGTAGRGGGRGGEKVNVHQAQEHRRETVRSISGAGKSIERVERTEDAPLVHQPTANAGSWARLRTAKDQGKPT